MMDFLRKQAQSTLIQAIVLIIAVVFVFWGVGSNLGGQRSTAASVNGTEISLQEFQRAYEQAAEGLRQQFGGQVPPELLDKLGIREQVLHRLIQAELLRQGGEAMGITVSGLPIQQRIKQMAVFQKDGRFDLQQYKDILSRNRMTPSSFEEGLKSDLQTDRVRDQVGSFATVSDSAVDQWLAYSGEEIKLSYVKLEPLAFTAKVQMDEKELAAWFEKNKDQYKSEPKVKLKYLLFDQGDDEKLVQVSKEELKAKYEQDRAQYQQPEQRHARHILLKVEKGAAEAVRTEKKRKAEEVLALTKAQGSDFAALAKAHSEDTSKEQGGDLGFFAAGRMVPAFDQAVFAMKAGEISGLVETEFGYHIIKLEEIRPASERSFEQVKDGIAAGIRRQQAKGLTFKRAAAAYDAIMRAGSLDKYSQQEQGKVLSTEPFARSQPPAGLTADPQFLDAAFKLKKGELSSIVELGGGYAVIFVDDVQEAALPELAVVREKVLADWTKEKAAALAAKAAEDLLADSRKKNSLRETADAAALKTTEFLKRSSPAGGKDALPPQLAEEAFKLSWKEKLPVKPMPAGEAWYMYEIAERRAGKADPAQREEARRQLLAEARYSLTSAWLHGLQAKAKIRINNALLK